MSFRDKDAIAAVLRGETDRFAELVAAYQEQAIRIAFTFVGDYEEARDVSQEAFVRAYRSLGSFHQEAKFSTWLYRIVVNACKDFHRRRARRPQVVARIASAGVSEGDDDFFMDVNDPSASPSDQLANRELSRRLTAAIEQLPGKQREAFSLHHLHGLPLDEVAAVMNCRLGTVKSHVFRAMENLRRQFAPWLKQEGSSHDV